MDINTSCYTREKEILHRENIINKVHNKIKISPEERMWLMTHPVYNVRYGADMFNIAIEHLEPNKWFCIKLTVESISYDNRMIPVIGVPAGKGKIITDLKLHKLSDKPVQLRTPIKMLGIESISENCEHFFDYFSELGILSVEYECDYFDKRTRLNMREASSTGNPDLVMRKETIDDHTVRYYCKSPVADVFDALVFNIQWTPKIIT